MSRRALLADDAADLAENVPELLELEGARDLGELVLVGLGSRARGAGAAR